MEELKCLTGHTLVFISTLGGFVAVTERGDKLYSAAPEDQDAEMVDCIGDLNDAKHSPIYFIEFEEVKIGVEYWTWIRIQTLKGYVSIKYVSFQPFHFSEKEELNNEDSVCEN